MSDSLRNTPWDPEADEIGRMTVVNAFGDPIEVSTLKDSGDRTVFASGAVRDMRSGKGRCDLLPLDVVSEFFSGQIACAERFECDTLIFSELWKFLFREDFSNGEELYRALRIFVEHHPKWDGDIYTMLLEVAVHFEDGAKKYGDNNWRKGIPVNVYIDSAIRHYLKFRRGDTDEPHDRAFCWNLLCAIWTHKHMHSQEGDDHE